MAYYSRHSIFLHDSNKQKLSFIQSILNEEELSFVLQEEIVYQYDGEPLTVPCISDVNWNSGDGYVWYDFETDMERISEKFNQKYPEDTIVVFVKTEDGFESLYEFQDGSMISSNEVIHYQSELQKVCKGLNKMALKAPLRLYEVIDIAHHPTIIFHYGAYTFIGYNIYEIYSGDNRTFEITVSIAHPSRNYNNLPDRIQTPEVAASVCSFFSSLSHHPQGRQPCA